MRLRYRDYWYDSWDDNLGSWNGGPLPWYALGSRAYDPVLERFLQPDPLRKTGLPDYVYANDDPADLTDPMGRDGVPAA